jgi:hypothetical protein
MKAALLDHLHHLLDTFPGLPPSLHQTLLGSCLKKVRLLRDRQLIDAAEANLLLARVHAAYARCDRPRSDAIDFTRTSP